jgi:hypothetical protein
MLGSNIPGSGRMAQVLLAQVLLAQVLASPCLAGIETLLMPMATMAEKLDTAVAAVQLVPWRWRLLLHCGAAQALRAHGCRRCALHGVSQMVLPRQSFLDT